MTAADVDEHAERGVNRLVVAPASADLDEWREQLSAFAQRLGLRCPVLPVSPRIRVVCASPPRVRQ
jgi:hypothetical protein